MSLPYVSIIIIGHNEAAMLEKCIRSALNIEYPRDSYEVIFVDSNSTDNSLEIAAKYPIKVIALKDGLPSPGAARNAGAQVAKGEIIHFLDGDMVLNPKWINMATEVLKYKTIACVFGRVKEMNVDKNIFNKIEAANMQMQHVGVSRSPAGGGTFVRKAFAEVNCYDPTLRAGEEIEIGYRLRRLGYKILGLESIMAQHDVDFHGFSHFWRRSIRDGEAESAMIKRCRSLNEIRSRDYILRTDLHFLVFGTSIFLSLLFKSYVFIPVILIVPMILVLRKTYQYYQKLRDVKLSFITAFFLYFNKLPMFIGHLKSVL